MEALRNKSILVTGATGTIGSFVADALIRYSQKNNADTVIYLGGRNAEKLRHQFGIQKNVDFLQYDMNAPIGFNVHVDYIIHAAGNAHPAAFNGNPVGTTMGNIESTFRLLEYLRLHEGKRLLYVSSGEVYGQGDVSLDSFDELYSGYLDVLSPRSCYPLSKRMTENLCSSYWKQYGVESVIVRPCHTYGPYMTETDNRAHAQFFRNALDGENIILKSAGTQFYSYLYVMDSVSGLLTVLLNGESGEAYNISDDASDIMLKDLAAIIADYAGNKVVFEIPDAVESAGYSKATKARLDSSKLNGLGWKAKYDIKTGIARTIEMLKAIN